LYHADPQAGEHDRQDVSQQLGTPPPTFLDALYFLVPNQILIAFVAELTVYVFWRVEGLFAELLRILEKDGTTGLGGSQRALRFVGIGLA